MQQNLEIKDMRKDYLMLLGFLMFMLGFLALILSLVGLQFGFMTWIDNVGGLFGFIVRLLLIVVGITLAYFGKTDLEKENNDQKNY